MKPSSSSSSSSKPPTTSPGRALVEKFPPPLMRFLRSSVGSRSTRSKSKSKSKSKAKGRPLFFRKKKPTAGDNPQQEPSSPKVTCIGQVRVRRSKNTNARSRSRSRRRSEPDDSRERRCCWWSGRRFLGCFRSRGWRRLVRFFCCRPAKVRTGSSRVGSNSNRVEEDESRSCSRTHTQAEESEERESVKEWRERVTAAGASSVSTPPKNALLLTRCRSAPYRSSSLACQLWGDPLQVSVSVSEASETEAEGTGGDSAAEKEEEVVAPPVAPLLTRSRSEPVRRGSESLDPLTSEFWRERRLSEASK